MVSMFGKFPCSRPSHRPKHQYFLVRRFTSRFPYPAHSDVQMFLYVDFVANCDWRTSVRLLTCAHVAGVILEKPDLSLKGDLVL